MVNKKADVIMASASLFMMAEREGFEPSVEVSPNTRLAGERLQPTRPSLLFYLSAVSFQPKFNLISVM